MFAEQYKPPAQAGVFSKNHHIDSSFCRYVARLTIMLANGDILRCSRSENEDVFRATCGGMGLTGVILSAEVQLRKIRSSLIDQKTIKTTNLRETMQAFDTYKDSTYSVAWIDCLAKGAALGRGLVMLGEHADSGQLDYKNRSRISLPVQLPSFTLNSVAVKIFNTLYYRSKKSGDHTERVSIDKFFYPLDAIRHWNRIASRG